MERLTFLNGDEIPCVRNDQCFEEQSEHYCGPAIDRLAAYEDTGLTPEEVLPKEKADEIALNLMRLADLEEFASYDRLRELAEADKTGRVVVLPCKLGDKIYRIQKYFNDATLQSEIKVKACIVGSVSVDSMMTDDMVFLPFDRIGKTVFFTREDAEKALEGMRNG